MRALCTALLFFVLFGGARAADCTIEAPCRTAHGQYLVHVPNGWDGKSPLPAVVFFHGYKSSAAGEMNVPEMVQFSDTSGHLLIVPDGLDMSWSFPHAPEQKRDEIAFVGEVLDDVEHRFPIDHSRLWASGFSIGGSMAWYAACYMGRRFAAFAPVAGSFWLPMPTDCPSGPANIRHIHGLTDQTFPLEGRAIRNHAFQQGDTWVGLNLWKKIDGCTPQPTRIDKQGNMICHIWQGCSSGKELQLCLHPGEHEIDTQWLLDDARWVDGLAKAKQP